MTLDERLAADLRQSVRKRDAARSQLLRGLRSAIRYAQIDGKREASDELAVEVLAREARRREEAIALLRKGGREDAAAAEAVELDLIRAYLPAMVGRETIESEAREVIGEMGAGDPSATGKVMGALMPRLRARGTVDGKLVNGVVRELLASG